jgi:ubiquinol-cytochrome c reductase iron-sulfur subunit
MTTHSEIEPSTSGGDPVADPGLPPHTPRLSDTDPKSAKRAERQVATMFGSPPSAASASSSPTWRCRSSRATWCGCSCRTCCSAHARRRAVPDRARRDPVGQEAHARRRDGAGAPPVESTPEKQAGAIAAFEAGTEESGIGRRKLIRNSLLGSHGAAAAADRVHPGRPRAAQPEPGEGAASTIWGPGVRVVNDVTFEPIRPRTWRSASSSTRCPPPTRRSPRRTTWTRSTPARSRR